MTLTLPQLSRLLCLALGLSLLVACGGIEPSEPGPDDDAATTCTAGETFDAEDGCNTCTCPESGVKSEADCTAMDCSIPTPDDDTCTPGETFDAGDGCNTCTCSDSGERGAWCRRNRHRLRP